MADTATLPPMHPDTKPCQRFLQSQEEANAVAELAGDLEGMHVTGFERRFHGKVRTFIRSHLQLRLRLYLTERYFDIDSYGHEA